jgi:dehydrogenase/reductase SDR family protein 12
LLDLLVTPRFLLTELPSFTRLGYTVRRLGWRDTPWNFRGQRWLVTGASTGIGREVARTAARGGATVIAAARSLPRLESLAADCGGSPGRIVPAVADLALVGENRRLAEIAAVQGPIDVLVNNVGVLLDEPATTSEGLDLAFATNLLGPFVLTEALFAHEGLRAGGCIVNVSSGGMYAVALDVKALARQDAYDGVRAYAYHKRAQVALTEAWRARLGPTRDVYVMHPGWVETPGVERSLPTFRRWLGPWLRDAAGGADTILWLAAERPRQRADAGIWFDRCLRPAHVWSGSLNGDSTVTLLEYLHATGLHAKGPHAKGESR